MYFRLKAKKKLETTMYFLSPEELLQTAQEILHKVQSYLKFSALSDWIMEIYLYEFTNNKQEISIPHSAKPPAVLKISSTGNPDKSRAMSALTFLLFKLNTLDKETRRWNLLTTRKNTSTSLNEKFEIRNLTFRDRYSPSSCFLGVFRNCIIIKRINVYIWQFVKLRVSWSHDVMTVVC